MTPMALNRYVKRKRRMTEPLFQNSHTQKKKEKKSMQEVARMWRQSSGTVQTECQYETEHWIS